MEINSVTCIGCGQCRNFCTMGCIHFERGGGKNKIHCKVDQDECVDCGICERSGICQTDSLHQPVHGWPRSIRGTFSNPLAEHKETKVPGRGTEEIKTNDITNRYKPGFAGIAAEMGRPGIGARLSDVQKVFRALAKINVEFESANPLSALLVDKKTGDMNPEVLGEKVLSCIIEFIVPNDKVISVLNTFDRVAGEIDTVFSIGIITKTDENLNVPAAQILGKEGRWFSFNGKTNLGLGKLTVKGANRT